MNTEPPSEALTADYTSATGQFRLSHPAAWVSEETLSDSALVLANTSEAMDRYRTGQPVDSGDLVVNVGFLPFTLLEQKELKPLDIRFGDSPDVFFESMLPMFQVHDDATLGEVQLVSLSEERDAGAVTVTGDGEEGTILMFPAGDRVVALVSTTTASGKMAQFNDVTLALAARVTFDGDSDALYGRLLSG